MNTRQGAEIFELRWAPLTRDQWQSVMCTKDSGLAKYAEVLKVPWLLNDFWIESRGEENIKADVDIGFQAS